MTLSEHATDLLRRIVIAIDGPSGSGKTTTARAVARRLGLRHLDTGAMYRAVTLKALASAADLRDEERVSMIADAVAIEFREQTGEPQRVILDGEDVTDAIRSAEVTSNVSLVSAYRAVREAMVRRQRAMADQGGVVLEGRDIGSVVLPAADVKVYLDASVDVRAERRRRELAERGSTVDLSEVRESIVKRDAFDSSREVSPLVIPVGARIIDTSEMSIEEQVDAVVRTAEEAAQRVAELIVPDGQPNPLRKRRFWYRFCQIGARLLIKLVWGCRLVRIDETDYRETYIYASSHKSNLDPPVVGSTVDREVHFVAKTSLFKNKLFGGLISYLNSVPIRKGKFDRAAMARFEGLLKQGRSVLIFPEGGRHRGEGLGKARPGVGYMALRTGCPVVPVYVDGTKTLKRILWWHRGITMVQGRPMRLTDPDLQKYQTPDHFRDFGRMVMTAIAALKEGHEKGTRS